MENLSLKKNEELSRYVEEVRACQVEIKKLNCERESKRVSA